MTALSLLNSQILDALSDHIAVLDKSGVIIYTNKAWEDFVKQEYSLTKVGIGDNYLDLIKKEDNFKNNSAEICENIFEIIDRKKKTYSVDYPINLLNTERWYSMQVSTLNGEGQIIISNKEISERVLKEKEVAEINEKFKTVISGTNTGIWEWNIIENKVSFNEEWGSQLGYKPSEIEQSIAMWEKLVHPEDFVKVKETADAYLKGELEEYNYVYRMRHRNGEWLKIRTKGVVSKRDKNGQPLYFIGIHTNVNKEEQYLQEINEYEKYLSSSMEITCIGNHEKYIKINKRFTEVLGYTQEDLEDLSFEEFIHPNDLENTVEEIESLANGEVVIRITNRHKCKNGSYKTLAWTFKSDSNTGLTYAVGRDITDLIKAQEKAQQYFDILDNSLNEMYIICAENLHFIDANIGTQNNIGYTIEELKELTPIGLNPDIELGDLKEILKPLILKEKDYVTFETKHLRKDGTTYDAFINLQLTKLGDKDVFVALALDISDRIEQEKELIKTKNDLSNIVDYANVGIAYVNEATELISVNPKFVEILEYENAAELLGKPIAKFTYADDIKKELILINELLQGKRDAYQLEKRYVTKNNKVKWVDLHVSSIKSEEGKIINFVGLVSDITDEKKAQDKLIKSENNYRDVIDSFNDVIIRVNSKGIIEMLSPSVEQVLGYKISEELNKKAKDYYVNKLERDLYIERIKEKGFIDHFETQLYNNKGEIIDIMVAGRLYKDSFGSYGIQSVFRDVTSVKEKEAIINVLTELSFTLGGVHYFNELSNSLSNLLKVEHVIIGLYNCDKEEVESIGYSISGELQESFTYSLVGTPCRIALDGEIEIVLTDVQKKYPKDEYLVAMNADSYIGITLFDNNKPIGIIAILDSKPVKNVDFITSILLHVKTRTETEISRTKIENLMIEREARFRGVIENSSEITCLIDETGTVKYVAPSITKILNYSVDEILGDQIFNYLHEDDRDKAIDRLKIRYEDGSDGVYEVYRLKRKDGAYKYFRAILSNHFNTDGINGFIINAQDISELIIADNERYRIALHTEEKERRRLSQDLHDGLGQTIAAASMYMNTLDDLVVSQLDEETYEIFKSGKELVNKSAKETRMVSHNIMPPSLTQFGLSDSLLGMISNYQKIKNNVVITFNSTLKNQRFNHDVELSLYRVVQELINNALKHSEAKNIDVSILVMDSICKIIVKDDGVGFDYKAIKKDKKSGIGLRNIEQRIHLIGGNFDIVKNEKGVEFIITVDF